MLLLFSRDDFNIKVLQAFVELHEFADLNLVQALRWAKQKLTGVVGLCLVWFLWWKLRFPQKLIKKHNKKYFQEAAIVRKLMTNHSIIKKVEEDLTMTSLGQWFLTLEAQPEAPK